MHSATEGTPETHSGAEATSETHSTAATETHSATELAPAFQKRIEESKSKSAAEKNREAHFTGKTPPQSPEESFSLNTDALPFGKTSGTDFTGKGTVKNSAADQLNMAKKVFSQPGVTSSSFGSGATELQTVLKSMYDLGRLIKRMPDDRLESQKETPSPTPPPYAFARRFVPFGKGTS